MAKDEFLAAITSVWWDIDDCEVPENFDGKLVAENIRSALSDLGYSGAVSISAYGSNIPESVQHAGISLNHVPPGVNVNKINELLLDLMSWAAYNPAGANILLICGEKNSNFSNALNLLGERGYNILLAQPSKTSSPLFAAAKTVWLWSSILAGVSPFFGGAEAEYSAEMREAKYKAATTSVWWDIDNCRVPEKVFNAVPTNIKSALLKLGYRGNVCISAYGDTTHIPTDVQSVLGRTGVTLNPGQNDNKHTKLLEDLMSWVLHNPAPANIFLLSGDSAFSPAMHHLSMSGYNILLSAPLPAAIKTVWHWTYLLAGRSPIGTGGEDTGDYKCKGVKTSVWWDMKDCKVPGRCNFTLIGEHIRSALFNVGYQGPVSIFAYGDTSDIPQSQSDLLALSDISLKHVSSGKVDEEIIFDIFCWTAQNRDPANLLLISGNQVFSHALRVLSERHYNVLLCASLPVAAKTVWRWVSICLAEGSPIGGQTLLQARSKGKKEMKKQRRKNKRRMEKLMSSEEATGYKNGNNEKSEVKHEGQVVQG